MEKSLEQLAVELSRAQGAVAGLQTALAIVSAAGDADELAKAGIAGALEAAEKMVARAEFAWLAAMAAADAEAPAASTPRDTIRHHGPATPRVSARAGVRNV